MRINPKAVMGIAGLALPVGVLIGEHVSWESTPQAKKRMLTHQLTFWGLVGAGLMMMHRAFFKSGLSPMGRFGRVFAAGVMVAPAFKVGEWLSNRLFPHQPAPELLPQPLQTIRPVFKPSPVILRPVRPLIPPVAMPAPLRPAFNTQPMTQPMPVNSLQPPMFPRV